MDKKDLNRYRLTKKIGKGSFGEIFLGQDKTNNTNVAIKLENVNTKHPQLQYESRIYRILEGCTGIPSLHWYGTVGDHNIMVIDLLGSSLENLQNLCNRRISLKSVLMLSEQLVTRLESIHSKNFLHRDVKPDNFLIGLGDNSSTVYAVDFGLAKKYRDSRNNMHILFRDCKKLTGTARYASVYTHLGYEQSRRDDLECLVYLIIYLFKGDLPWQDVTGRTKDEKYQKIMAKKMSLSVDEICSGLPNEIGVFLSYVKNIKFEEKPDYRYLKNLIKDVFVREQLEYDSIFDWTRIGARKDSLSIEDYKKSENTIEKHQ